MLALCPVYATAIPIVSESPAKQWLSHRHGQGFGGILHTSILGEYMDEGEKSHARSLHTD